MCWFHTLMNDKNRESFQLRREHIYPADHQQQGPPTSLVLLMVSSCSKTVFLVALSLLCGQSLGCHKTSADRQIITVAV